MTGDKQRDQRISELHGLLQQRIRWFEMMNAAVGLAFAAADHELVNQNEKCEELPDLKVEHMSQNTAHPILSAKLAKVMPAIQREQHAQLTTALKKADMWRLKGRNGWNAFSVDNGLQGKVWSNVNSDINYQNSVNKIESWSRDPSLPGIIWRLPLYNELYRYARHPNCPHRSGNAYRLGGKDYFWLANQRHTDVDDGRWVEHAGSGDSIRNFIAIADLNLAAMPGCLHHWLVSGDYRLYPADKSAAEDVLAPIIAYGKACSAASALLTDLDWRPARLPKLSPAQLRDPQSGLWELWRGEPEVVDGVHARNPALDVRDRPVAIDFGTSSTVVAYDDHGSKKLLRVGVRDFDAPIRAADFENPTALEFVDLPALLAVWQSEAYRPMLNWDDLRCAHEALDHYRSNEGDATLASSILLKIKQWALREASDHRVSISDQTHGTAHTLPPLTLRNPVKGALIQVGADDPLDPVELYAWFLGMVINWRRHGLHLKYYMSFPVDYPREVKDKILAAFRRGLQRSLPASLVAQREYLERFAVEERASEPAAYAACAMPTLGLSPTPGGLAYAVFDFGGGTSDFDFGLYRLPAPDEEDEGYEAVFEHFSPSGDRFLGGENLLENLAYQVFLANLDVCRKQALLFSRPLDARDFPGSELLLSDSQHASANMLMLITRLRGILEGGYSNSSGIEKLSLFNRAGERVSCELLVQEDVLQRWLRDRIVLGVKNFFTALHAAFASRMPDAVHILLAGNASRSQWVAAAFELGAVASTEDGPAAEVWRHLQAVFAGGSIPEFFVHAPLPVDEANPYRPTAKTGVALGLLELCPGSAIKVVNHVAERTDGEAPFAFYVGRIRQQRFQPVLLPDSHYQAWHELGPQREGVFELVYSELPLARAGGMAKGDPGLLTRRLEFSGDIHGHRVFARAIAPDRIEVCSAASVAALEAGDGYNHQTLTLE